MESSSFKPDLTVKQAAALLAKRAVLRRDLAPLSMEKLAEGDFLTQAGTYLSQNPTLRNSLIGAGLGGLGGLAVSGMGERRKKRPWSSALTGAMAGAALGGGGTLAYNALSGLGEPPPTSPEAAAATSEALARGTGTPSAASAAATPTHVQQLAQQATQDNPLAAGQLGDLANKNPYIGEIAKATGAGVAGLGAYRGLTETLGQVTPDDLGGISSPYRRQAFLAGLGDAQLTDDVAKRLRSNPRLLERVLNAAAEGRNYATPGGAISPDQVSLALNKGFANVAGEEGDDLVRGLFRRNTLSRPSQSLGRRMIGGLAKPKGLLGLGLAALLGGGAYNQYVADPETTMHARAWRDWAQQHMQPQQ